MAYSTGDDGLECDLIEAHMWFNLAAARGHEQAADMRAEIAVHGLPDRCVVREGEAYPVDGGGRHKCRQDQARQGEEFDAA